MVPGMQLVGLAGRLGVELKAETGVQGASKVSSLYDRLDGAAVT